MVRVALLGSTQHENKFYREVETSAEIYRHKINIAL